ncbi:MAG TPA: fumarylacetoacetate hydrolase family protein [Rhizomicrobium sp.]|jgi:2-keto-4-pentenoate hydratase/2-oxohepta-3-ene-1,7-dioic acid hydratase in catechol pathway|nr:fumarylacetoacetate hydrolase family protein [Rhizomicrobium sp.]
MKLATFDTGGAARVAIVSGESLIDLSQAAPGLPQDMIGLIAAWPQAERAVRQIENSAAHFKLADVHLQAPVPRPQKILAIGLNYADHIAESGLPKPERQIWFSKLPNAVNGPCDPIQIPRASSAIDYEAELVAIVGRRCRHVTKEDAASAIFGYAAGNDVSVRDWQFHTPQWILGKSFDTHAPFGPWIVTADEIGDPHALGIRCFVNGEMRQDSNTKNLVFNVHDQVALLTQAMTLESGDAIFTGTPGGVGFAAKPPVFLKEGDVVRVEIDRIGALEARMAAER